MTRSVNPIFRLDDVSVTYGGRTVLNVPELEIFPGEIFALIGPSGAGKSTLLRLLNFLEPPARGKVIYQDTPFSSTAEIPLDLRRQVTTVFQRPILLDRSVWDNVVYGLRLRGERDGCQATGKALDLVSLGHLAHQRARTLSGGEAQRVALARALVIEPAVLLLDEPTANLDPANVGLIEEIVNRLNQESHTTVVLVTHNVFQAHRLAHRVAFLLEGRVIESGTVEDIFDCPDDPRTRAFVRGEMVY